MAEERIVEQKVRALIKALAMNHVSLEEVRRLLQDKEGEFRENYWGGRSIIILGLLQKERCPYEDVSAARSVAKELLMCEWSIGEIVQQASEEVVDEDSQRKIVRELCKEIIADRTAIREMLGFEK